MGVKKKTTKVPVAGRANDLIRFKRNYQPHGWLEYDEANGCMRKPFYDLDHDKVYIVAEVKHQPARGSSKIIRLRRLRRQPLSGSALKLWNADGNEFIWTWRDYVVIL